MTPDSLDYSKTYIAFDSGCGECRKPTANSSHDLFPTQRSNRSASTTSAQTRHTSPWRSRSIVLPQRYTQARGLLLSWPAALARLRPFCWPELSEFTAIMNI